MFYQIGVLTNFAKFTRKHLCRILFLIKLQVSILQLYLKKRLRYRCFLMNFAIFYRTPPDDCFCSKEKYFTNKIVKSPLRKKKMQTAGEKNSAMHRKKNLNTAYYIKSSYFFIIFKIPLFHFSLLPMIYSKHEFLETMQSHGGCICYRKLFLLLVI